MLSAHIAAHSQMLRGDKILYCTAAVAVLLLSCLAQSQDDKFAGNLIQEDDVEQPLSQPSRDAAHVSSSQDSNVTGTVDEVVQVVPSPEDVHDPQEKEDNGQPAEKKTANKAPRPVRKPESVGFVPPPEEEPLAAQEEAIEQVEVHMEKRVVHLIPTLPPRFAIHYVFVLLKL